ncbi:Partner and localizer of BRCA2 [Channa argus]|uniref:Partner and localizer of BRCA2 n=1 Tax=Channa argus TaxID=215402 RepID=A0A6G1PC86_CHAAH|nr:Partner and localizer of BRCA2 [Channa argus]
MEDNVGDIAHCEEQLRSTLYCDDKEKLRRKLALLQREYLKTARRLQRAERLDAVRRHVRSRITQQNHKDQEDQQVASNRHPKPSSLTLNTSDVSARGVPQCEGHSEGPADTDYTKRSQVIRFLLPSDAACPQTPDPSHDEPRGHRPSPAMRLRSQRSRLRWERRSAEAVRMTENSEDGQEHSGRMETERIDGEKKEIKSEETEIVNESEELFSASESESPSLLLTHWNTHANTDTGDVDEKEVQACQEQREMEFRVEGKKESPLQCWNPAIHNEDREKDCTLNGKIREIKGGEDGDNTGGESEIRLCEKTINTVTEQNEAENKPNEKEHHDNTMGIKEEESGMDGEKQCVGLLDSCTLVEGLLFPAEYYVRTTRRMASSQSQPDMQAVILSQLSTGRHRRGRGRGRRRGLGRNTQTNECLNEQTQSDFCPLTTPSGGPSKLSHLQATDASTELTSNSLSSSEISDQVSDSQNKTVGTSRPARGRRTKRARGRGRPQTPRSFLSLDTNDLALQRTLDNSHPISIPVSHSLTLHSADKPPSTLIAQEVVPLPDNQESSSTHSTATQTSSGVNGAQSKPMSVHLEEVYPVFLKSCAKANRSTKMSKSTTSWHSLLLPSSPPAQTSLGPLSFQSPVSLINNPMNFDIHQDFHLPDDQFASLKLRKLRQVALESGIESLTSPSHITRNRERHSDAHCSSSSDPVLLLPLPLSLTPTITDSPGFTVDKQATAQSVHSSNLAIDLKPASQQLAEGTSGQGTTETPREQQPENPNSTTHTRSTECVSVVEDFVTDCVSLDKEHESLNYNSHNSSSGICTSNTHRSKNHLQLQPHLNLVDRPAGKVNDSVNGNSDQLKMKEHASEKEPDCAGGQETSEGASDSCTAAKACNDTEAPGDSAAIHLARDSSEPSEAITSPVRDTSVETKNPAKDLRHTSVHSQLLQSPPLASPPGPFITPNLPSSAVLSSPTLPSLGLTPHPVFPLTSSPSAPSLTLPPPHSPSIQTLSPPALSPCPSFTSLHSSLPPASPSIQKQSSLDSPGTADHCHQVEPLRCLSASSIHLQSSGGLVDPSPRIEESANENKLRGTYTLKAPAGGCLVDACCLTGHSGGLFLAAAGKWAVCLWNQSSTFDWSLIHTWTFDEPVINVFPVPDAAGLMCVSLGQLEIREVRILSCSSLSHVLLCKGCIQAVVGAYKSKVVTSSLSATGSTLEVFNVSDSSSTQSSQLLVSPGVCVGALASVDGLSDALIGTDECGSLFIWNLKTGQLLQRVTIAEDLSHTSCLRGYSYCGVLFVLLQHQLLISLDREGTEVKAKDQIFSEEPNKKEMNKTALFSLVAVNPLSGKSVVATKLYPPKAWSGRLCEADVNSSSVVSRSQNGCVCVWELGHRVNSRMVWAPESEGWQLARWGGPDVLVTGHHNGDVTLHYYSQNSLCH